MAKKFTVLAILRLEQRTPGRRIIRIFIAQEREMIRVKTSLTILGLLSTLSACSGQSTVSISIETPTPAIAASATHTPWVEGTQAALGSPTPWIGGIETALAAFTPATPDQSILPTFSFPPTMEQPTDFSPVLYGGTVHQSTIFLLLGGVGRETWLAPDISVSRFSSPGPTAFTL